MDIDKRINREGKLTMTHIGIHDYDLNQPIDDILVRPDNYDPHLIDRKIGYTSKELSNAKTPEQVDVILKSHLRGCIVGFWGMESELDFYPDLLIYAEQCVCIMQRYSSEYGPWSHEFGNRSWVKLEKAAKACGYNKPDGSYWHDPRIDAAATAHIWKWLDRQEIPKASVKRASVKQIMEEAPWDSA